MTLLSKTGWEIAGGLTAVAAMGAVAAWMALRKRPSPDELELARRKLLVQNGRLVDGMLLDVCSVNATDGRTLTMEVIHLAPAQKPETLTFTRSQTAKSGGD